MPALGRNDDLTPAEVAAELEGGDAVLVDLRESEETAALRIPGAVHVPRGMLEFRADPSSPYYDERLAPSKRVILHCAGGGRSALAARALTELGYENVAHVDGGIAKWREEGLPTES